MIKFKKIIYYIEDKSYVDELFNQQRLQNNTKDDFEDFIKKNGL
ncbi:hypothetical protein [Aquibacillus halophilus]|nr:hypothetical protein [Aquibacillus halophilus]